MPGRIVVFGATGYTGRLVAERLVGRGRAPGPGRPAPERLQALASASAASRRPTADVMRQNSVFELVDAGRRARVHGRAVREVGRARRARGDRRRRHLPRLDRRAGVHPQRLRGARAAGAERRRRAADRDGLRLRAGRARRRAGARAGRARRRPRRRRLLLAGRRPGARTAGTRESLVGATLADEPRVPRRAGALRARRPSACARSRSPAASGRRCRSAAPSTSACRRRIQGLARSTSTSAGSGRWRGRCRPARWSASVQRLPGAREPHAARRRAAGRAGRGPRPGPRRAASPGSPRRRSTRREPTLRGRLSGATATTSPRASSPGPPPRPASGSRARARSGRCRRSASRARARLRAAGLSRVAA